VTSADPHLPSRQEHPRAATIALVSAGIWLLFSLRDLLVLLSGDWPHLYGVVGTARLRWEEVVFYLPYAAAFSWDNLLPVAPAVDIAAAGVGYQPVLSIFLLGLLYNTVGFGSPDAFLLLMHSLLPLANFWLAYLIYRLFIQKTWAIFFSFLGICYFSDFSSAGYVAGLLGGAGGPLDLASLQPPEITRVPFPGLSLALFSTAFYLCVRDRHLTTRRVVFLAVAWGLQAYIYPFNFLAGLPFFGLWLVYARYVTDRGWSVVSLGRTAAVAVIGMAVSLAPLALLVAGIDDTLGSQFTTWIAWSEGRGQLYLSGWGWFLAYALPALFALGTIFLFRGDYYELFYRFYPVFAVMAVDFLIGSLHLVTGRMFAPELYQHRISGILFRFYYFIPLIYFLQAPLKPFYRHLDSRYQRAIGAAHGILQRLLIGQRLLFCGAIIAFLAAVEVMGAARYLRHHQFHVAPAMRQVEADLALASEAIGPGVIVLEKPAANLLVSVIIGRPSLLASSYGNFVSEEEIRSRLILYARLLDWEQDRFVEFMTPGPAQRSDLPVIDEEALDGALGWWLLHLDRQIDATELAAYRRSLVSQFTAFDLEAGLRRFRVAAVLSSAPVTAVRGARSQRLGDRFLTTFPPLERP
jgi:hypothetical protein